MLKKRADDMAEYMELDSDWLVDSALKAGQEVDYCDDDNIWSHGVMSKVALASCLNMSEYPDDGSSNLTNMRLTILSLYPSAKTTVVSDFRWHERLAPSGSTAIDHVEVSVNLTKDMISTRWTPLPAAVRQRLKDGPRYPSAYLKQGQVSAWVQIMDKVAWLKRFTQEEDLQAIPVDAQISSHYCLWWMPCIVLRMRWPKWVLNAKEIAKINIGPQGENNNTLARLSLINPKTPYYYLLLGASNNQMPFWVYAGMEVDQITSRLLSLYGIQLDLPLRHTSFAYQEVSEWHSTAHEAHGVAHEAHSETHAVQGVTQSVTQAKDQGKDCGVDHDEYIVV